MCYTSNALYAQPQFSANKRVLSNCLKLSAASDSSRSLQCGNIVQDILNFLGVTCLKPHLFSTVVMYIILGSWGNCNKEAEHQICVLQLLLLFVISSSFNLKLLSRVCQNFQLFCWSLVRPGQRGNHCSSHGYQLEYKQQLTYRVKIRSAMIGIRVPASSSSTPTRRFSRNLTRPPTARTCQRHIQCLIIIISSRLSS